MKQDEWKYWTGNHEYAQENKWYLGVYKDKSGSTEFIKICEKFYDRYNQEINAHWMDQSIGYFIEQDIQE